MAFAPEKIDILTVGYYADFSRFFYLIKKSTQKINKNINFFHINLHLSGQIYSKMHKQASFYLPYHSRKTSFDIINDDEKNFFRQFISYHLTLVPEINEDKLIMQAKKYYQFLEGFLESAQPRLILLSGDSRMPAEIIKYLANKMTIRVMYFEQAPLGRTILDSKGVNANSSFRSLEDFSKQDTDVYPVVFTRREKWKGYKKYRVVDFIIEKFLPGFQPIEHLRPKRNIVDNNVYKAALGKYISDETLIGKKQYLLVLQVPDDVNMIYHSPWFSNHSDIVKAVHQSLPENAVLIVREHPLYNRLYEKALYEYIINSDLVFLDQSPSLQQAISDCHVVVVNNSTVGLESIELGKPVVVLGNAYYDRSKFCIKYDGKNLKSLLVQASEFNQDEDPERIGYLSYLFNKKFIEGHFRDLNGPAPDNIARWIVKHAF